MALTHWCRRRCSGAFGVLAGTDSHTAQAAHARLAAAPSMAAVPERGGAYHRPRKDTCVLHTVSLCLFSRAADYLTVYGLPCVTAAHSAHSLADGQLRPPPLPTLPLPLRHRPLPLLSWSAAVSTEGRGRAPARMEHSLADGRRRPAGRHCSVGCTRSLSRGTDHASQAQEHSQNKGQFMFNHSAPLPTHSSCNAVRVWSGRPPSAFRERSTASLAWAQARCRCSPAVRAAGSKPLERCCAVLALTYWAAM